MAYVPYTGAAGPSREQRTANEIALQEYCVEHGKDRAGIIYDRWGFCNATGELDQASWEETIAYIG